MLQVQVSFCKITLIIVFCISFITINGTPIDGTSDSPVSTNYIENEIKQSANQSTLTTVTISEEKQNHSNEEDDASKNDFDHLTTTQPPASGSKNEISYETEITDIEQSKSRSIDRKTSRKRETDNYPYQDTTSTLSINFSENEIENSSNTKREHNKATTIKDEKVQGRQCLIQPIRSLKVLQTFNTSTTLWWPRPTRHRGNCKLSYFVTLTSEYLIIPIFRFTNTTVLTVDNLKACTTYNVSVKNAFSNGTSSDARITVTTEHGLLDVIPFNVSIKDGTKNLDTEWKISSEMENCVTRYEIKWNREEKQNVTDKNKFYKISNFTFCSDIEIHAYLQNGKIVKNSTKSPLYKTRRLDEVNNFSGEINSNNTVLLSWSAYEEPNCATGFKIVYGDKVIELSSNVTKYTIENFPICSNISIIGYNNWMSEIANSSLPVSIKSPWLENNVIGPVVKLKSDYNNMTQDVNVTWDAPENAHCNFTYEIKWYSSEKEEFHQEVVDNFYVIQNFDSCQNIYVTTIYDNKRLSTTNITSPLFNEELGKVKDFKAKIDSRDTILSWSAYEEPNCATGFKIVYGDKDIEFPSHVTKYTIENFPICSNISIIGYNNWMSEIANSSLPVSIKSPWLENNVIGPVVKLKSDYNNMTQDVNVTWDAPENAHCNFTYEIKWYSSEKEEFHQKVIDNFYVIKIFASCQNIYVTTIYDNKRLSTTNITSPLFNEELGKVKDFKAKMDSRDAILSWSAYERSNCATGFRVSFGDEKIDLFSNITEYTIKDFTICSHIAITGLNNQTSENALRSGAVRIDSPLLENNCSGPVLNLNAIYNKETRNVYVSWDPPTGIQCTFTYKIDWFLLNGDLQSKPEKFNNYTINDFASCKNISVITKCENNTVGIVSTYSPLFYEDPQIIEHVYSSYSSESKILNLNWTGINGPTFCAWQYRIISTDDDNTINATVSGTSTSLQNFEYCDVIYVLTINKKEEESNSTEIRNPLIDGVPPKPILTEVLPSQTYVHFKLKIDKTTDYQCFKRAFIECLSIEGQNEWWIVNNSSNTIEISNQDDVQLNVTDLSEYTNYTCRALVYGYEQNASEEISEVIKTLDATPSPPRNLSNIVTNSTITIEWEEPNKIPGVLKNYSINITQIDTMHDIPPNNCTIDKESFEDIVPANELKFVFKKANPHSKYNIVIQAVTDNFVGEPGSLETITLQSPSAMPRDFRAEVNQTESSIVTKWSMPCTTNGILKNYIISMFSSQQSEPQSKTVDNVTYECIWTDLSGDLLYMFEIYAENEHFSIGEKTNMPIAFAQVPPNVTASLYTPTEHKDEPHYKAEFIFYKNSFSSDNGEIKYYAIILASAAQHIDSRNFGYWDETNETWPKMEMWTDQEPIKPYQITPLKWNPFATGNTVVVTIGADGSECNTREFCNGHLRPNTNYSLILRGFTMNAYRDSKPVFFKTQILETATNLGAILGSILGIFFASLCAVISLYLWRQKKLKQIFCGLTNNKKQSSSFEMGLRKFNTHYKLAKKDPTIIQKEFEELHQLSQELNIPIYIASLVENKKRNRYVNILPYDETLVKLSVESESECDYINASFIKGFTGEAEYIATQGPMPTTVEDFWKMVIQQDVSVIVMVTQFEEMGKTKCHRYFPKVHEFVIAGDDLEICCTTEMDFKFFKCRIFNVSQDLRSYNVTHLQYLEWPDFGCPEEPSHVLQYIKYMREKVQINPGKIAIHCSAGVGRTGTLIAVDVLLQHIKSDQKLDIFNTVLELRKQRMNMVQTERQYSFIYDCIFHATQNPMEEKRAEENCTEPIYENTQDLKLPIINNGKHEIAL